MICLLIPGNLFIHVSDSVVVVVGGGGGGGVVQCFSKPNTSWVTLLQPWQVQEWLLEPEDQLLGPEIPQIITTKPPVGHPKM